MKPQLYLKATIAALILVISLAGSVRAQAPAAPPASLAPSAEPFVIGTLVQSDLVVAPDVASFLLPNAWLRVRAGLSPKTRFITQLNFSRTSQVLLEARISHALSDRFDIDGGLFMAPFGRESLTFPGYLPLSDRGRVVRALAPFWQVGAGFVYHLVPDVVNFRGAVFNGNGGIIRPNDNQSFLYVGRLEGTSRGALTRLDLGAGFALSNDEDLGAYAPGPGRKLLLGADAVFDSPRVFLITELVYASLNPEGADEVNPLGAIGRLGFRATPEQAFILGIDAFDPGRTIQGHHDLMLALAYSHYLNAHLRFLVEYQFAPEEIDTGQFLLRMQVARL